MSRTFRPSTDGFVEIPSVEVANLRAEVARLEKELAVANNKICDMEHSNLLRDAAVGESMEARKFRAACDFSGKTVAGARYCRTCNLWHNEGERP